MRTQYIVFWEKNQKAGRMMNSIKKITKRDGRTVEFDVNKIAEAIFKAAQVLGGRDREMAMYLAKQTELYLLEVCHNQVPTVEQIQDAVEKILIENGHARTAKEYILYRAERTRARDMNTKLMRIYEDLTFKEAKENEIKREYPRHGLLYSHHDLLSDRSGKAAQRRFFHRSRPFKRT